MSFDLDISDIPFNSFYGDEKCKKLERILRQEPEFAEYKAKRYRTEDNPTQDSYVIINEGEKEEYMMWMNEWEVDALDDSEMLSYVSVTIKTSRKPNPVENWMIAAALFAAFFFSSILLYYIVPEFQTYSFYSVLSLTSFLLMVIFGVLTYSKSKSHARQIKDIYIELMQQHPLFLQAVRRFASLTNITDSKRAEYEERLDKLEQMLREEYTL